MAVSGRRFAAVAHAVLPIKIHCRASRAAMICDIALPDDHEMVPIVLLRVV